VIAWEPIPDTFAYLERNVAELPNVTPINKALVSEESGSARMYWDYENPGASHVIHDQPGGLAVEGVNISDALDQEGIPDALKLDIEGDELGLLRADPRLLTVPVIVLEYCDAQIRRQSGQPGAALLALLYDAGYDITWAGRPDASLDGLPTGNAYTNIVAIRRAA
jgi:FkbM family methyltransferase